MPASQALGRRGAGPGTGSAYISIIISGFHHIAAYCIFMHLVRSLRVVMAVTEG